MKKLLAALVAAMMLMSCAALAETGVNVMTVTGSGVVNVLADQATVVLGVEEKKEDVLEAQDAVNEKINAIYDALIEYGVEPKNIGTDRIYISAAYTYPLDIAVMSGYTASNSIEIRTTDIDSVGEIIDIAFAAGANELNAVNFSASNAGEAQQQALALAVENAMTKAQTLADAAGVGIGEVLSLEEQPSYGAATGAAYLNLREESAADAGTLVQASTIEVSATVVLQLAMGTDA